MPSSVQLDTSQVNARLRRMSRALPGIQAAALYETAQEVMTESKKLVPVDTGNLRASGGVAQPEVNGAEVSVKLGYGGTSEAYALRVHEDLSMAHPNGGQAKFLEQPLANGPQIRGRLLWRVRKGMEATGG